MMIPIKQGLAKMAGLTCLSLTLALAPLSGPALADDLAHSQEAQWLDQDMGSTALNFDGNMYLPMTGAFQALGAKLVDSPEGQTDKIQVLAGDKNFELYQKEIDGVPHIASDLYGGWYPLVTQGEGTYVSLAFLQTLTQRTLAVTGSILGVIDFAPAYDAQGVNTNPFWQDHLQAYQGPAQGMEALVETAKTYGGVPYVYGGMSPAGFDCSGFTSYVYAQHGLSLPRTAAGQRTAAQWISEAEAQPGDLVFWGSPAYHVGIYLGDGNYIHSPSPGKTVTIQHKSYYAYTSLGRIA